METELVLRMYILQCFNIYLMGWERNLLYFILQRTQMNIIVNKTSFCFLSMINVNVSMQSKWGEWDDVKLNHRLSGMKWVNWYNWKRKKGNTQHYMPTLDRINMIIIYHLNLYIWCVSTFDGQWYEIYNIGLRMWTDAHYLDNKLKTGTSRRAMLWLLWIWWSNSATFNGISLD